MNIEFLNPKSLKPHPQNSRKHSDEQIQQLMASISKFGFNGTILIDEDNVILAGHGRTQAMIRLGRETIPCLRKEGLSDIEKRAYVIADNAIGLNSEWDEDVLASEVAMLLESGLDLSDFGIPLGALAELEAPPPESPHDVRALESKADEAPITPDAFDTEMARTDTPGVLPIVPQYAEHHEAFIILCDNIIDEAWLRNKLGLEETMKSYKDVKAQRANVITCAQFRERLQ